MAVEEYAKLYGKSIRTIKRYKTQGLPLDDEQEMRRIIGLKKSRLGVSKLLPKLAVATVGKRPINPPPPAPANGEQDVEYIRIPEMFAELEQATGDLISLHFALASLRHSLRDTQSDIYERLTAILDITRPWIEGLTAILDVEEPEAEIVGGGVRGSQHRLPRRTAHNAVSTCIRVEGGAPVRQGYSTGSILTELFCREH